MTSSTSMSVISVITESHGVRLTRDALFCALSTLDWLPPPSNEEWMTAKVLVIGFKPENRTTGDVLPNIGGACAYQILPVIGNNWGFMICGAYD